MGQATTEDIVARMIRQGDGGGWRVEGGGRRERRGRGAKTPRERENNALKQQAATTTLIGHFVHLFDLFKLWDN